MPSLQANKDGNNQRTRDIDSRNGEGEAGACPADDS